MNTYLKFGLVVFVSGAMLAACDSEDATGIRSLGQAFVKVFNAGPNSQPVNAQSVALNVNPRKDPFNP